MGLTAQQQREVLEQSRAWLREAYGLAVRSLHLTGETGLVSVEHGARAAGALADMGLAVNVAIKGLDENDNGKTNHEGNGER